MEDVKEESSVEIQDDGLQESIPNDGSENKEEQVRELTEAERLLKTQLLELARLASESSGKEEGKVTANLSRNSNV